ncbi:MAG: hypothetical protein NXH97_18870 [Rhodobacteraceae bacterium]|nr:hypothetical protein [Paracoccaceae bacterium]
MLKVLSIVLALASVPTSLFAQELIQFALASNVEDGARTFWFNDTAVRDALLKMVPEGSVREFPLNCSEAAAGMSLLHGAGDVLIIDAHCAEVVEASFDYSNDPSAFLIETFVAASEQD